MVSLLYRSAKYRGIRIWSARPKPLTMPIRMPRGSSRTCPMERRSAERTAPARQITMARMPFLLGLS